MANRSAGAGTESALLGVGGSLVGLLVSAGIAVVRRRTEDPVLESVITLLTRTWRSCWPNHCTRPA